MFFFGLPKFATKKMKKKTKKEHNWGKTYTTGVQILEDVYL